MTDTRVQQQRILDLGCGNKLRPGAVGIDFNSRTKATIIHDLNVFPYPIEDAAFDEVYIDNVIEHLDNVIRVMEEVHRITAVGGLVKVIVPYFRSCWASIDPTHTHSFTVQSFDYFDPDNILCQRYDYSTARFKVEKVVFNESLRNRWFRQRVVNLANLHPSRYEYYVSHLFPLDDLSFYLRRL
jgi:SAM-dependent methyltransferase